MAAPFPKCARGFGCCAREPGKASGRTARGRAGKVPAGFQERKLGVRGAERKSAGVTSAEKLTVIVLLFFVLMKE